MGVTNLDSLECDSIETGPIEATSLVIGNNTVLNGFTPIVVTAAKTTWTGGLATLAKTVSGVLATDIILATVQTKATEASYLVSAAPTTNTITFTLSAANTSNDAVISYVVIRNP